MVLGCIATELMAERAAERKVYKVVPLGAQLFGLLPTLLSAALPLGALLLSALPLAVLLFGGVPLGNWLNAISIVVVPIYMASAGEVF